MGEKPLSEDQVGYNARYRETCFLAEAQDLLVSPHCSIGPVALAAALHLDMCTPNFMIQESFSEFDVPWRDKLVQGWNPLRGGMFELSGAPGLGLEIDEQVVAAHPYVRNSFPSLWDRKWSEQFAQNDRGEPKDI